MVMILLEEENPFLMVQHDYSHIANLHLLPRGLHFYVDRGAYSHHGIYIGDGKVIHFLGPKADGPRIACKKCGFTREMRNGVVETCLDCFLRGGFLSIYRYNVPISVLQITSHVGCPACTSLRSKPPWDVVETAKQKLKEGFGKYNLTSNNCEHFATFCMTGTSFSQQVPATVRKLAIISSPGPPMGSLLLPSFKNFGL